MGGLHGKVLAARNRNRAAILDAGRAIEAREGRPPLGIEIAEATALHAATVGRHRRDALIDGSWPWPKWDGRGRFAPPDPDSDIIERRKRAIREAKGHLSGTLD
jgi:hypothetical protein